MKPIKTKRLTVTRPDDYGYSFKYEGKQGTTTADIKVELDKVFGKDIGARCFVMATKYEGNPEETFTFYIPDFKMPFMMEDFINGH